VIWSECIKKNSENCDSQKLTDIDKNQESTSLSKISKLLLKVCIWLFKNSEISCDWCRKLRDDTEIKNKKKHSVH
jgi:hypothetical protein